MTAGDFKALEPFFEKWYIEEKVAEGNNSIVYKAFCVEDGEKINRAVRVIKFPASNEEISRALDSERFSTVSEYLEYAEKTVCENISKMYSFRDNKNIVRFEDYTIVREASCFYVILLTEYLTPLSDYIKQKRIRHKDVVKLGWDICSALEAFRLAGITHRNIKPENIYIDEKSNFKLGEFGIDGEYRIKKGLSSYTAPEAGTEKEIISADIYSLGIVLYRLLNNNRAPFLPAYPAPVSIEDREKANFRRLRGDMLPAPANADSRLSHIIFNATAFKAEDRYDSPSEMKLALEEYVKTVLTSAPVTTIQPNVTAEPEESVNTRFVPSHTANKARRTDGADSVTVRDKAAFAEAFRDDDIPEEKSYKKWYLLIVGLAVILIALVVVFIGVLGGGDDDDIVFSPDYSDTTISSDYSEETTEEETTEQETTEEETTEEETTEEETTEEETTEAETTEEETTESETTEQETTGDETTQTTTEPSQATPGTADSNGRVYYDLTDYYVIYTPQTPTDTEIIIELNNLPDSNPMPGNTIYLCTMLGSTILDRSELDVSIVPGDQESYLCYLTVTDEYFYYSPEEYDYYVLFSAGAIETQSSVNTEFKVDF